MKTNCVRCGWVETSGGVEYLEASKQTAESTFVNSVKMEVENLKEFQTASSIDPGLQRLIKEGKPQGKFYF